MASVKPGHENLAPLVALGGDDDEIPRQLGDCKRWVLLWPKSLLRLEAAGSTPTTNHPPQGMNTNTHPTQLASPVVPGEEEATLLTDDVVVIEEAMHDAIDEDDDDPLQYLNTSASDNGRLMAQQH